MTPRIQSTAGEPGRGFESEATSHVGWTAELGRLEGLGAVEGGP